MKPEIDLDMLLWVYYIPVFKNKQKETQAYEMSLVWI